MKKDVEIIFIDETGFNQSLTHTYGYSKIGERCVIETAARTTNITVLAAITKGRILCYQLLEGSSRANEFGAFLSNLIRRVPDIKENLSQYVFFMDNSKTHSTRLLQPLYRNLQVLFNAPYSPFLNPIEELFGHWKRNFRRKSAMEFPDIIKRILKSVEEIDEANFSSSFMHTVSFLEKCLNSEAI